MRLSIGLLLVVVSVIAVTLAGLVRPSYFIAGIFWTSAVFILGFGVLSTILANRADRPFWIGFSTFGCGHMILALAPGFDNLTGELLISRQLLDLLGASLGGYVPNHETMPGIWANLPYSNSTDNYRHLAFVVVGQSAISILTGTLGGILCRLVYGAQHGTHIDVG